MSLLQRIKSLFRSDHMADEFALEIESHIEMKTEANVAAGMSSKEARRSAMVQFGSLNDYREQMHSVWVPRWLEQTIQDVQHSARSLKRNSGFVAVVVATLAIAIGMNTAVFSLVEAITIRPLPYPSSKRLVWIAPFDRNFQSERDNRAFRNDYLEMSSRFTTLERMAAYGNQDLPVTFNGSPSQERVASITDSFWSLTAGETALGRLFNPNETHVIVLSYALYAKRFHTDPHIIGQSVSINEYPYTIVGVLSPKYKFWLPQQLFYDDESRDIDAYIPIPRSTLNVGPVGRSVWQEVTKEFGPGPMYLDVIGLLRENSSLGSSSQELQSIVRKISAERHPDRKIPDGATGWRMVGLATKIAGNTRLALIILTFAVFLILVIACCNIANLFLVRTMQRRHELATRVALGASRFRILRQLLAESICLSLCGGLLGLALAQLTIKLLAHLWPQTISRLTEASLDLPSLLLAFALSLLTGILFGAVPTMLAFPDSPQASLQEQSAGISAGSQRTRIRKVLVTSEMALALVLLVSTGLLFRSFSRMTANPPGFEPDEIATFHVSLAGNGYEDWQSQESYVQRAMLALRATPNVEEVGLSGQSLQTSAGIRELPTAHQSLASVRAVSIGYLKVMGIGLKSGKWPSDSDFDRGVVVNESFADAVAPGKSVVGMQIMAGYLRMPIVGVVHDFRTSQLDATTFPQVYGSYRMAPLTTPWTVRFYVRIKHADANLPVLRQVLITIDPSQPVFDVQTVEQSLADSMAPRRLLLFLMALFSTIALLLSVIGLYGVVSYTVSLRTQEIGIRMALGANRLSIIWMVVLEALKQVLAGIALGLVLSVLITPLIEHQLYETAPNDPRTFVVVATVLLATAVLASLIPAARAASINPQLAIRHQ
jgi:putative ABC transport system permease protein